MHRELYRQKMLAKKDGLVHVLYNWFTVGLQGGFRCQEWCQEDGTGKLTKVQQSKLGRAMAFVLDNITFYTADKIQLDLDTVLNKPDAVAIVCVRFAWQKNGDHGIHRWFYRNTERPFLCAVNSWIEIVQRFVTLMGRASTKPLAIFVSKYKGIRLVTANVATKHMRELAVQVHKLTDDADINKFSCHSLRVGACCIYFATGYQPDFIQRVLRWRSDAWRTYVRDLVVTAIQVVVAMNAADDMPLM